MFHFQKSVQEESNNKKLLLICLLCIVVLIVAYIVFNNYNLKQDNRLANAEEFLQTVFEDTESQYHDFSSLSDEDQINWISSRYSDYMTQDGLDDAMKNRVILMGMNEFQQSGENIELEKLSMEKRSGTGNQNWYNYKITLISDANSPKEISGSLEIIEENNQWLVNQINRNH